MGSMVNAMEMNAGYIWAADVAIRGWHYWNYGKIIGSNSVSIEVKSLSGSGTIQAPAIRISCDEFNFTGTIDCATECTIFVKKPFEPEQFTKQGEGSFSMVVSPYPFEKHTLASLGNKLDSFMLNSPLSLTDDSIEQMVKEVRYYARVNMLDQQEVATHAKQKLKDAIAYHADRVDNTLDSTEFLKGLKTGGVAGASVGLCALTYTFGKPIRKWARSTIPLVDKQMCEQFFCLGVLCTGIVNYVCLPEAAGNFTRALYPNHKQKYEKLVQIESTVTAAFDAACSPEEHVVNF